MTPPSPQGETRQLIAVSCGIQVGPTVQRYLPVSRGSCANARVALSPELLGSRCTLVQQRANVWGQSEGVRRRVGAPNNDYNDDTCAGEIDERGHWSGTKIEDRITTDKLGQTTSPSPRTTCSTRRHAKHCHGRTRFEVPLPGARWPCRRSHVPVNRLKQSSFSLSVDEDT